MIKMSKQRYFDVSLRYSMVSWGVLGCLGRPGVIRLTDHRHTIIINSAEEIKESGRSFQFLIVRGKKPFI